MLRDTDDKSLLTAEDEQKAFRILYDRYWAALYKSALHKLDASEDAEDIVQEIFISLWRNRFSIEIEHTLTPYLFSALKYSIIKRLYLREKEDRNTPLAADKQRSASYSSEEIYRYRELQHLIGKEVSGLPQRMQQVYRLSREDNFSLKEISQQLLISEQTVKNTLSTALRKLRIKISHLIS